VVVNFFANESPLDASSKSGCVQAKDAVVKGLAANPSNYYVNLHSPEFPKGAIRGQTALLSGNGELAFTGGPMSKGLMLLGLCVIAAGSTLLAVGQRRRVAYHRPRH
jgi:CHRD domain